MVFYSHIQFTNNLNFVFSQYESEKICQDYLAPNTHTSGPGQLVYLPTADISWEPLVTATSDSSPAVLGAAVPSSTALELHFDDKVNEWEAAAAAGDLSSAC
jgi:hypothetical protein